MKRLLLTVLFSLPCFGSFTFTLSPPVVTGITQNGARILSATSDLTLSYIVWDTGSHVSCTAETPPAVPCPEYPKYETQGTSHGVFSWFIGGAPAGTTIYFRVCSSDGGAWVCTSEQTFQTSARSNPYPAVAALPLTTPSPAIPTQSGATWVVGGSSCGTLLACWTAANCGDTIIVPSTGTTYSDFYFNETVSLPVKTCTQTNQLLVTTDQPAKLPPVGVRIDPSYEPVAGSIQSTNFPHYPLGTNATNNFCYPGTYLWPLEFPQQNTPAVFAMQQCVANPTSYSITNITGCVNPGGGDANWTNCTVTTSGANGFSANDIITVSGVAGIAKANGTCQVNSINSATSFSMSCAGMYYDGSNTYVSGGLVHNYVWQPITTTASAPFTLQTVSLGPAPTYLPPSGTCAPEGAWGYDPTNATVNWDTSYGPALGTSSTGSVVRCMYDKTMTNLTWQRWTVWLEDPLEFPQQSFALDFSGSSWIYVRGIRVASPKIPPEPLFLGFAGTPGNTPSFQGGKTASSLIHTSGSSSNITFDQVLIDCADYPRGMASGVLKLDGNNISLINSYMSGCGYWFGPYDRGAAYDDYASAAIIRSVGTGFLLSNNYLEGYGITMHFDDSLQGTVPETDVTTVRNTFYRNPTHFYNGVALSVTR